MVVLSFNDLHLLNVMKFQVHGTRLFTPEVAAYDPHLHGIASEIPALLEAEILILIGCDLPQ